MGEHLTDTFDGRWFYPTKSKDQCERWPSGTSTIVVLAATCCDVIPPGNAPCFLGVGAAEPVPSALEDVLRP
jgi:hypothetical protein